MTDLLEVAPSNVDPQTRASLTRFASDLGEGTLRNLLLALSDSLASGCTVALLDVDADYTPAQVAKQLRMSRTHLYKLLDSGHIPSHRVGRDIGAFGGRGQEERRALAGRGSNPEAIQRGAIDELVEQI